MRRLLLSLTLLLFAATAGAQAYKWKDANGTMHYSDTPPPTGTDYKPVKTTGSAAPLAPPPAVPVGSASAAKPAVPLADTPENRAQVCKQLQGNMDMLAGSGPLSVDDAKGNQVALDATRRRQELATASDQYKQYCSK
jgi:hypothetical protein